jgi:hypothetical protein
MIKEVWSALTEREIIDRPIGEDERALT